MLLILDRTCSIGSWEYVLEFMGFCSIFTNIILFTYASDQIEHIFPALKYYRDHEVYSVLTIFGIEHVLLLVVIVARFLLNKEPHWVKIFLERLRFKKQDKAVKKAASLMVSNSFLKSKTFGMMGKGDKKND